MEYDNNHFIIASQAYILQDAATIPPFGFLATLEGQSQAETAVIKPSPVPAKKKATAPPSKYQKRGTAVTTSLEVHQSSTSPNNVSIAS
jgi:hypothetical protein